MFDLSKSTQPQSVKDVLCSAIQLWKESAFVVLPLSLIISILGMLPNFFLSEIYQFHPTELLESVHQISFLHIAGYTVFFIFTYSILLHRIYEFMHGRPHSYKQDIFVAIKKFPYALTAFTLLIAATLLGYVAFIIPGLALNVMLIFYLPLVILKNHHPIKMFRHSCKLVWGHWWRTFAVFVIPILILLGINFIIDDLTQTLLSREVNHQNLVWQIHHVARIIFTTLFMPFWCSLILIKLRDLKIRHKIKLEMKKQFSEQVAQTS